MPNPVLHIFKIPDELAVGVAEFLKEETEKILLDSNKVHICLSGGNTPKKIFSLLSKSYSDIFQWSKMHFYWGDERCVPENDPESNYGEAKRLLFDNIKIPEDNIHFINGKNIPEEESKRYSKELLKNIPLKNNLPAFDINILGIGDDGHTASIFPDKIELIDADSICAISKHPGSGQKRITITGKTLNNSKIICFLISGNKKAKVLKHIIQHSNEAMKYPAYFINPDPGRLDYFIDNDAASLL